MATINVGVGDVYVMEYADSIPVDATIEVTDNKIPHTSGGVTFDYTANNTAITDDKGIMVDRAKEDEILTVRLGILEDMVDMYEWLSVTAKIENTDPTNTTISIGGDVQSGKTFLFRYVHTRKNGKKVRYTALVLPSDGFSEPYTKGTAKIVDCTMTATPMNDSGKLLEKKIEK